VAEQVRREADQILAKAMDSRPVSLVEHRTRGQRITAIVHEAGGPITTREVIDALRAMGDPVENETSVSNELTRQADAGDLIRKAKGVYDGPATTERDHTTSHHTTHDSPLTLATSGGNASPPPQGQV